VTGADWSGHRFITRNEGVPGSSPGVGLKAPAQSNFFGFRSERGTPSCHVKGSGKVAE
jgi:hypothetical protein